MLKMEVDKREMIACREPADMTVLVNKATESLQELMVTVNDCNMSDAEMVSIDKSMVDEIISALKEVDGERLWLHASVEEETIKSSVLRHKLNHFPRNTDLEIRAATKSVRESNHAVIQGFKDKIQQSVDNQKEMKENLQECNKLNDELQIEQQKLREDYDEILSDLNGKLLKKSSMQIKLNETREKLREIQATTKDFELALVELNEDMITERQESAWEQARLKKKITETVDKLNQQKKLNVEMKKKFDDVQNTQYMAEGDLAKVDESVLLAERKNTALQEKFDELSGVLQEKLKDNHLLTIKRDASKKEVSDLQELYETEKAKLEHEIESVVSQLEVVKAEFDVLNKQRVLSDDVLESEQRSAKQNEDDTEDTLKKLRLDKEELIVQSNECTRLKRINAETQGAITRIQQEHIAAAEILAKEIEHLQESLEAEKRERLLLQEKRDAIIKEASDYVNEFNSFAIKKTQNINEGKGLYQEKTNAGRELQRNLKDAEILIRLKQKDLKEAKSNYIYMQKDMKGKMKKLQNNISKLESDYASRSEKVDATKPGFSLLEETFAKKTEEFQQMKKVVVEVKTKKHDLEESVEEKQARLNDMEIPKNKMVTEINEIRQCYLDQLRTESEETISIENEIYSTNQKLTSVEVQNDRFKKAIEYFESDIDFMQERMEIMHDGRKNINITTAEYGEWLEMQWRKHMELDKTYHDQDILLLDDIKRVEEMTSERERRILHIHSELEQHLDALTTFLENVSQMRPKDEKT